MKLHMHIAHQFLFRKPITLAQESLDFRRVVLEKVFEGDRQWIRRGEDLDFRNITHLVMLDGLPTAVANMANHENPIREWMPVSD